MNLDKRVLEGAPTIGEYESLSWQDETWNRRVHEYYRQPPFWGV